VSETVEIGIVLLAIALAACYLLWIGVRFLRRAAGTKGHACGGCGSTAEGASRKRVTLEPLRKQQDHRGTITN
jgi:hypothetical protein